MLDLYHGGEAPVDGIISKSEAIARLKTYKLVDQVLFHTDAALKILRFVDSEVVV